MASELKILADELRFLAYVLWFYARQTFMALPGPIWVKCLLVVICLAIPGPQDELVLIALTAAARRYRVRHPHTS